MRGNTITISRAAITAALVATTFAGASAVAQSANTWSLPEPTGKPTASGAQGPVDGQNPVVQPDVSNARPAPTPVPTIAVPPPQAPRATPTPVPSARPSATPGPAPRPSPTAQAAEPTSAPQETAAAPAPAPSQTAAVPEAAPAPLPEPSPAPAVADAPAPASQESWPFWWWAAPLALLVALGALLALRRRAEPETAEWDEPAPATPAAAATIDVPPAPEVAVPPAAVVPAPAPVLAPPPATPLAEPATTLSFEPVGLRLSLVYATLQYRLVIAAGTDLPATQLLGDMIGAHASIPPQQQLAPAPETLALLKTAPPVPAGEALTLSGEVQLPLSAIRQLQQGNAAFFVPLVRLYLAPRDGGVMLRRVFTVGIDGGGAALAPLRLDTGPRDHRDLAAREIEAARDYPADHHRAAG